MSTPTPQEARLVQVAYLAGEPLARLAEDRLRQEGIDCVLRSAGVGPGGWGAAAGLTYSVWVRAEDEPHARQLLGPDATVPANGASQGLSNRSRLALAVALLVMLALLLGLADAVFKRLL